MKNTQLIKLLRTFDQKEIKRFREFISSPFFNKNKNVTKLFEIIRKIYPDFEQEKFTKEFFDPIYNIQGTESWRTWQLKIYILPENEKLFEKTGQPIPTISTGLNIILLSKTTLPLPKEKYIQLEIYKAGKGSAIQPI